MFLLVNRWWFLPHVVTSISYAPLTKQHHVIPHCGSYNNMVHNTIHCDIWYVITKFSKKQPLTTCHSAVSSCHTAWDSISSFSSNNGYDKTITINRHSHHTWYSAGMYWLMISSLYCISLLSCRMLSMRSSFSAWNSVLSSAICGVHWHNHYNITLVPSMMLPTSSFDAWNCFHTSFSFFVFPVASSWRLAYFSSSKACSSCIVNSNYHGVCDHYVCACVWICVCVCTSTLVFCNCFLISSSFCRLFSSFTFDSSSNFSCSSAFSSCSIQLIKNYGPYCHKNTRFTPPTITLLWRSFNFCSISFCSSLAILLFEVIGHNSHTNLLSSFQFLFSLL